MANMVSRLTTNEVADRLGCSQGEALQFLKAARVPFVRIGGKRSACLWDGARVEKLLTAIRENQVA